MLKCYFLYSLSQLPFLSTGNRSRSHLSSVPVMPHRRPPLEGKKKGVARLAVGPLTLLCHCIHTGGFVWPGATLSWPAVLRLAPLGAVLGGWRQREEVSGSRSANSEKWGAEPGGLGKVSGLITATPFRAYRSTTVSTGAPHLLPPLLPPTRDFLLYLRFQSRSLLSLISRSATGRHVRCKQRPLPAAN